MKGAIVIQALDDEQIVQYLDALGTDVTVIRELINHDVQWRELAQSPLMLSIMVLAYRGKSANDIPDFNNVETQRRHLFEIYIERMFDRRIEDKLYTKEETKQYLHWLAQKMQEHLQSVFQIEHLQPTWLSDRQRRSLYKDVRWIVMLLFGLLWGVPFVASAPFMSLSPVLFGLHGIYGLAFGWLFTGTQWRRRSYQVLLGLAYGPVYGLALGQASERGLLPVLLFVLIMSIAGLVGLTFPSARMFSERGSTRDNFAFVEKLRFLLPRVKRQEVFGVVLVNSLIVILFRFLFGPESISTSNVIIGMVGASLSGGMISLISSGMTSGEVELRTYPNQGVRASLSNANWMGLLYGLGPFFVGFVGFSFVTSFGFGTALGIALGISFGFWQWFFFGGYPVIQHVLLRRILHRERSIPQNYARFLDYAASLILIRKVGGGYIFIHRYLLEYFADFEQEKSELP